MADLPQPSEGFEWAQALGRPALICRPLQAIAAHFFTTRHWALAGSGPGGWDVVAEALEVEPSRLVQVRQVHGTSVFVVGREASIRSSGAADIIVAGEDAGTCALAVRAADCVPLLIGDRQTNAVAAAHAGWRGLAARVPATTVAALAREFGSEPAQLVAAIGPSIGACCYQVGADVRDRFTTEFGAMASAPWFLDSPVRSDLNPMVPALPRIRGDHCWFFDPWAAARDQLLEAGLEAAQIFAAELCTASHPAVFSSYRREGVAAGRLAGVIRFS